MISALPTKLFPIQLIALLVSGLLFEVFSNFQARNIMYALGFSHYFLGFIYSRADVTRVLSHTNTIFPLILLGLAGVGLFQGDFSLVWFFGLHHAINEAYIFTKYDKPHNLKQHKSSDAMAYLSTSRLKTTSFVTHLAGYLVIVDFGLSKPVWWALFVIFSLSFVFFQYAIRQYKAHNTQHSGFSECLLLGVMCIDYWVMPISIEYFVMYHFVFWILFPAQGMWARKQIKSINKYLLYTAITWALFLLFGPLGIGITHPYTLGSRENYYWFVVFSYAHITLSFAISKTNPAWVQKLFVRHV